MYFAPWRYYFVIGRVWSVFSNTQPYAFLLFSLRVLCWCISFAYVAWIVLILTHFSYRVCGNVSTVTKSWFRGWVFAFLFRFLPHRVYVVCTPTLLFRFMSCLVWLFEYATMCIFFAYVAWIVLMHFFCVHCLDNVDAHSHSIWPLWECCYCDKIMIQLVSIWLFFFVFYLIVYM